MKCLVLCLVKKYFDSSGKDIDGEAVSSKVGFLFFSRNKDSCSVFDMGKGKHSKGKIDMLMTEMLDECCEL